MFETQPFMIRHFVVDEVTDLTTHVLFKFSSEKNDQVEMVIRRSADIFQPRTLPVVVGDTVDLMFFNHHNYYGTDFSITSCIGNGDDENIMDFGIIQSSFVGHIRPEDKPQEGTLHLSLEAFGRADLTTGCLMSVVPMFPLDNVTE